MCKAHYDKIGLDAGLIDKLLPLIAFRPHEVFS